MQVAVAVQELPSLQVKVRVGAVVAHEGGLKKKIGVSVSAFWRLSWLKGTLEADWATRQIEKLTE